MQFAVSDFAVFVRAVAFPNDRYLVATGVEVTVKAVIRNVQLTALEPVSYTHLDVYKRQVVLEP